MNGRRSRAFRAYQKIKSVKPARSLFDLTHSIMLTTDMFKLQPCCFMEMSPGDTFHIWNEAVTRMNPLNAPVMSEITQSTHYFFVPYRLLWSEWVKFITGGDDGEYGGDNLGDDSEIDPQLPRWIPINTSVGSLWDSFGFPTGVKPVNAYPLAFLKRAYNLIWNEYYRDENRQEPVDLDDENILYRDWKKEYFTSSLLSQQRGVSPVIPLNANFSGNVSNYSKVGTYSVTGPSGDIYYTISFSDEELRSIQKAVSVTLSLNTISYSTVNSLTATLPVNSITIPTSFFSTEKSENTYGVVPPAVIDGTNTANPVRYVVTWNHQNKTLTFRTNGFNSNIGGSNSSVTSIGGSGLYWNVSDTSTSESGGLNVKDLRQAFQIQKWMELANRGGVRYTEFLRAFFGVSPRDDRMQRPEYIGGTKSPVIVSEVVQTSSTANEPTPQGYLSGHGVGVSRTYVGSYSASEYGILIGLLSYTTPPLYSQGINRQWLRRTKFDFLFPQFTGLSEQAIEGAEIYALDESETNAATENRKVWGFNEIYDELRSIPSMITGKFRTVFNYWHLGRVFDSKPANDEDFVSGADVSKRIFVASGEVGFLVHFNNIIRAVRPLPKYGTPRGV